MTIPCFRGELYYAELGRGKGSEQRGFRPVVILQNDVGNKFGSTTIIAPISCKIETKAKLPTHYELEPTAGLVRPSVILLEQIRVIDKRRLKRRIGRLSASDMDGVEQAIKVSIGLRTVPQEMIFCLCDTCSQQLRNIGIFTLRKLNLSQTGNETCTYCGHSGRRYELIPRKDTRK